MRTLFPAGLPLLALALLAPPAARAGGADLTAIKSFLVTKVTGMDKASHDYEADAAAYSRILQAHGGNYEQAALQEGGALAALVSRRQGGYRAIHNEGYETIEGITAGPRRFVQLDN